jgi:hypothetical protein
MVHACYFSTCEFEEDGSRVQGQPALHSEAFSQKKKKNLIGSYYIFYEGIYK